MTTLTLSGSASGVGVFTVLTPNSANTRTLTLPDATTTLVGTDTTQTLTNKTIQGGAITSGTAVASTSGTSIDFTGIPSWVKRITVMFNGVSTNGTSGFKIQLGTGATPTFTNTGYVSYGVSSGVSAVIGAVDTTGIIIGSTSTAANLYGGNCIIATSGSNAWSANGMFSGSTTATGGMMGAGSITLGATLTAVRITTGNGTDTFDAGSINILYE